MGTASVSVASYRFMHEHAGHVVGRRAESALQLARAEGLLTRAKDAGVASVEWVYDEEPWDEGTEISAEEASEKFASNAWTGPFGCVVRVFDYACECETGDADAVVHSESCIRVNLRDIPTESLWGIVVGQAGTNDPYCRVVAAELASELEDDLRQALGDVRDARDGIS